MNVSQKIERQLQQIPAGAIFRYQVLSMESYEYSAASKKIERLIANGTLKRASKGLFYKPKQTVFGVLQPNEEEILNQYLFKNGQRVAYVTGVSIYNKMSLTTQVPTIVEIASKSRRTFTSFGNMLIKSAKSYVEVTNDNYELLGILDAIKDFNTIPDLDKVSGIRILTNILKELEPIKYSALIQYSLKYPPRVRAFLGAMLDGASKNAELGILKKSLSPLTKYKYDISEDILPNAPKWNLV